MWATIISGAIMIYINSSLLEQNWFLAKLSLIVWLILYSFSLEKYRKKLANNNCKLSGKFFTKKC
jgi:putative membrane protein